MVVIGGGKVAERKVARLLEFGARITLVSPELSPGLRQFHDGGRLRWIARKALPEDLEGAALVFLATSDEAANASLAVAARERHIPINRSDDADDCDFILPSVFMRDDLCVGVFSGGAAPALAKWLRRRLEGLVDDEMAAFVAFFARARRELGRTDLSQKERAGVLGDVLGTGIYEVFRRDGPDAALDMMRTEVERRRSRRS